MRFCARVVLFVLGFVLALSPAARAQDLDGPQNAAATMGERLFLETRFAEFFFAHSHGDANYQLKSGDPAVRSTQTLNGPVPGPFSGQSMNCRACHLVDEFNSTLGNRTYCDFTTRSPIPQIGDGRTHTPRNSPLLVDALLPRSTPLFLHFDGEFASAHDLIIGTLTGRNYGWKPTEYATAIAHIARIIREDNGTNELAQSKFGGGNSYAHVLSPNSDFPVNKDYRLADQYTLGDITITNPADPGYVTDHEIVEDVAALIEVYLDTLVFAQDADGNFIGSPYDVFLMKNGLPTQPDPSETPLQYSQRLLTAITNLASPQFVTDPADGSFTTHAQSFQFGAQELAGLEIFFTLGKGGASVNGQAGNCVACHAPPTFTDFVFHNTGAAQEEYESVHGAGSFMKLPVPGLAQRQAHYNAYLPPTTNHPHASGSFISPPVTGQPELADLGLWNVFANPDFPAPQPGLQQVLLDLLPLPSPRSVNPAMQGGNFVFSVTNAGAGWTYYVLLSTNLLSPQSAWETVSTNLADANGHFDFTNSASPVSAAFYSLSPAAAPASELLPLTIARFKTPTVRDLGHSQPYLHTGRKDTIEDVLEFYQEFSGRARDGEVRNADPELQAISVSDSAVTALAAFLRALNEDYTD